MEKIEYEKIELIKKCNNFQLLLMGEQIFQHAQMFVSRDQGYANLFSKAVASAIVCEKNVACEKCESCLLFKSGTHPDILVYPTADKINVADSESIIENAQVKPMISEKKVFVLLDFDKATPQAQNKLLKIFEEPPKNVIFIISATNESNVLQTIKSRVVKYGLNSMSDKLLKEYFLKKRIDENILEKSLFYSEGQFSSAVNFVLKPQIQKDCEFAEKVVFEMKKSTDISKYSTIFSKDKESMRSKLFFLIKIFSKLQKENFENQKWNDLKNEFSPQAISKIIFIVDEAKRQLDFSVSPALVADKMFFSILEVKHKWK